MSQGLFRSLAPPAHSPPITDLEVRKRSQSAVGHPTMNIALCNRTDHCQAHTSGVKTETRDGLNCIGSDLFDSRLDFFWMNHVLVSDDGFPHPHDLVSGALQAELVLADRVLLRLSQFFFARRFRAEPLQFKADCL